MLTTWPWQLMANDPVQLQKMLRRLESYAARKGLTVYVQISYIVNFNAYRNSAVPVFVSTIRSLKREILLPTWECYLISTWTYDTMLRHILLLMQLYAEWKSLVLEKGFLTGLMWCCGFSRHMRCQLACMPVRFGLRHFWGMTMVSAILCRSPTWRL